MHGLEHCFNGNASRFFVRSSLTGSFRIDFFRKTIDWIPPERYPPVFVQMIVGVRMVGWLLPFVKRCLVLHATTAIVRGKAISFLGPSGTGKSTLLGTFLNKGHRFLSDDLAVIQPEGGRFTLQPGPPEIRLWSEAAAWLGLEGAGERLFPRAKKRRIHLPADSRWRCARRPAPLRALYLLARGSGDKVRIEPIDRREAWRAVSGNIYNQFTRNREVLLRQFELTIALSRNIPVKRIFYPAQFQALPRVYDAVLDDLRSSEALC